MYPLLTPYRTAEICGDAQQRKKKHAVTSHIRRTPDWSHEILLNSGQRVSTPGETTVPAGTPDSWIGSETLKLV